jgi:hypothetical protein
LTPPVLTVASLRDALIMEKEEGITADQVRTISRYWRKPGQRADQGVHLACLNFISDFVKRPVTGLKHLSRSEATAIILMMHLGELPEGGGIWRSVHASTRCGWKDLLVCRLAATYLYETAWEDKLVELVKAPPYNRARLEDLYRDLCLVLIVDLLRRAAQRDLLVEGSRRLPQRSVPVFFSFGGSDTRAATQGLHVRHVVALGARQQQKRPLLPTERRVLGRARRLWRIFWGEVGVSNPVPFKTVLAGGGALIRNQELAPRGPIKVDNLSK